MDIVAYLLKLIKLKKEIGLEGLGTFYKQKIPAHYHSQTKTTLPPSYRLCFTSEVKENQTLAYEISKDQHISLVSANQIILKFTAEITHTLSQSDAYQLKGLGTLSKTNGEINFLPEDNNYFSLDFFGLPPIQTELASIKEAPKKEIEHPYIETITPELVAEEMAHDFDENPPAQTKAEELPENKVEVFKETESTETEDLSTHAEDNVDFIQTVTDKIRTEEPESFATKSQQTEPFVENSNEAEEEESEQKNALPVQTPQSITNTEDDSDVNLADIPKKGMHWLVKLLIFLVIVAAAGAVLYLVNPRFYQTILKQNTSSQVTAPVLKKDSLAVPNNQVDTLVQKATQTANDSLKTDSLTNITSVQGTAGKQDTITYEIISVAYRTPKEVEAYINRVKSRNIVAKPIHNMPGKLIKISIGTYQSLDSAQKYLDIFRKKLKNPEIYIYINNNKE